MQRPDPRGPDGNTGFLFRLAYQHFQVTLTQALDVYALSLPEYSILSAFDARPTLTSAELARLLDVTPQSANITVHRLVTRRLLLQARQSSSGRALPLRLSRSGRRTLDRATVGVRRVERDALAGLDAADRRVVRRWLSALATGAQTGAPDSAETGSNAQG